MQLGGRILHGIAKRMGREVQGRWLQREQQAKMQSGRSNQQGPDSPLRSNQESNKRQLTSNLATHPALACCPTLQTPYITEPPPDWQPGWRLQDGVAVDKELHATLLGMLRQMNRGIATLKDIPEA